MENNVIELIAIINERICSIIYVEGKTGISIEEFLNNNPQIQILDKYEFDYKYFKQSFELKIFHEANFNILYTTAEYI